MDTMCSPAIGMISRKLMKQLIGTGGTTRGMSFNVHVIRVEVEIYVFWWHLFSDIGVMDELGFISINGRLKDMIIRGGENIYPREIEDFLIKHDDVIDVQVFNNTFI